jgi:serine/threonine protein kinase
MLSPEDAKPDHQLPSRMSLPDQLDGLSDDELVGLIESALAEDKSDSPRQDSAKARRGLDLIRQATGSAVGLGDRLRNLIGAELAGHAPPKSGTERLSQYYSKGTLVADGRYRLESLIGEGGMGMVWVAEQREPVRRRVAIKLIKPGMDSRQVLQRFEAERQALGAMDHPNIARVFDGGLTERDHPFFVMELVNGADLTTFCDEAQLTVSDRLEIFCQIAQAIQHAHHKGVLHRDLKPSNILVTMIDGKPVPKIIDFGLAKVLGSQPESAATGFGMVVGTVEYMAPEQAGYSGQDVDTRADIYSLGVILYELLTGLRPFDSDRIASAAIDEILRIIKTEEPIRPSIRVSSSMSAHSCAKFRRTEPAKLTGLLRRELDWVVMKSLEKDRNRRYDSAKLLAEDVRRYLNGEPVTAHPPNASYRLRKFVGRHRLAVLMASVVLAALLVSIAGIIGGFIKAKHSESIAIEETKAKEKALIKMREAQAKQEQAKFQALQALRSMTDEFMGAEIARDSELSIKDQVFLKNIISQFDAFSDSASEDLEGQAIRADARVRVGRIYSYLDDQQTAESHLREAMQLWKQLQIENPEDASYRASLASCQRSLGSVMAEQGQMVEADSLKRAALSYWSTTYEEAPSRINRLNYAASLQDVGLLCYRQLKFDEAEKLLLQSMEILEDYSRSPGNRERLASVLNSLAAVYEQTGQIEKSEQFRDQSVQLRRRNVRRFSARTEFKHGLAVSLIDHGGNAFSRGDWSEAMSAYQEAQLIYQGLADQFPSLPEYRLRVADCLHGLGRVYEEQNRNAKALGSFAKETELREALLSELTERNESKSSIASLQYALGKSYAKLFDRSEAEATWLDAIRSRESLLQQAPDDYANISALASLYQALSGLQLEMGQSEDAVLNIESAVRLRRETVKLQSENSLFRRRLAASLLEMGQQLCRTSRSAEAAALGSEGCEILKELHGKNSEDVLVKNDYLNRLMDSVSIELELRHWESAETMLLQVQQSNEQDLASNPDNDQYRRVRRRHLYLLTQLYGAQHKLPLAQEVATQLAELGWNRPRETYFAACALAKCIPLINADSSFTVDDRQRNVQQCGDEAVSWLRRATELGYGVKQAFDHDRDLDPLRHRVDFQNLMSSLANIGQQ